MNEHALGGSGQAGDIGASSISTLFPRPDRFVATEDFVTVELLPLELLDLFVAVVCVVMVDTMDGDVNLALANAVLGSSTCSSPSSSELDESSLPFETSFWCETCGGSSKSLGDAKLPFFAEMFFALAFWACLPAFFDLPLPMFALILGSCDRWCDGGAVSQ